MIVKLYNRRGYLGECGVSALEMALILPLILLIVFGIIDFGRLYSARVVLTNLAREGGSLASRDIQSATNLITMLQDGASPLNLATSGQIYITKIDAGNSSQNPYPTIDSSSAHGGALSVQSSIGSNLQYLGLPSDLYQHLVFNNSNNTADISAVTVVEVFYQFTPISPLSNFIPGLLTINGGGKIISSRAVF
jgi:Flp pilus assembly protein TadG